MRTLPTADRRPLRARDLRRQHRSLGAYFAPPEGFTRARGHLSSLLVGLSLFGTYLSSNTFPVAPTPRIGTLTIFLVGVVGARLRHDG